ncbi:uncharacterized protein MKK02DRAFT_39177 [Dioszegia hungarica]|uniref:Uncharacterized protein n=1 Tax=Dioszegia hungarica TaxID=4972 RepID=A0AA38H2Y9_9TREE|nr:uncharacterized protein MKK02DRAFT_39177 [Dioszegia hungarica]KAI9633198.1 hypothetical protein MKK02DRAFT_39177 [Dioszegia hungarica]
MYHPHADLVPAGALSGLDIVSPLPAQPSSISSASAAPLLTSSAQTTTIGVPSAHSPHDLHGAISPTTAGPFNYIIPPAPSSPPPLSSSAQTTTIPAPPIHVPQDLSGAVFPKTAEPFNRIAPPPSSYWYTPPRSGTATSSPRIAPAVYDGDSSSGGRSRSPQVAIRDVRTSEKAREEANTGQEVEGGGKASRAQQEIREELSSTLARAEDFKARAEDLKAELKRAEQQDRENAQAAMEKAQLEKERAEKEMKKAQKEANTRVEGARKALEETMKKASAEARAEVEAAKQKAEAKWKSLRQTAGAQFKEAERDAQESVRRAKSALEKAQAEAEVAMAAAVALAEGVALKEEEVEEEIIFVGDRRRGEGSKWQPFLLPEDEDESEVEEEVELQRTERMGDLRARGGHTSDMEDEMVDMESGLDV